MQNYQVQPLIVPHKLGEIVRSGNLQVRNAQLDKEARELRLENEGLAENVEYGRAAAASNEEVLLSAYCYENQVLGMVIYAILQ